MDQRSLLSRRRFLGQGALGVGGVALWHLLASEGRANPSPHFRRRAKNVIFLFMAGAPSQLDLLDPKPEMRKWHGRAVPAQMLADLNDPLIRGSARIFASPRVFRPHGQSGIACSDFIPHLGEVIDEICLVRSMRTDMANHTPAQLLLNCGMSTFGHPSMGAWVTYGLGVENQDLPGFIVLSSNSGAGIDAGTANWGNGFLPSSFRGVTFRSKGDAVLHLNSPVGLDARSQRARLDVIADLNRIRLKRTGDPEIASRIASYELAFRMQIAAPELLDLSHESKATREMYGLNNPTTSPFGSNCLLARRMVERGVRFVQVCHSTWDDHADLNRKLKTNCDMTDRPSAALVRDLKQRGLLDETLVIWGGEFGRTPMNEVRRGVTPGKEGRDHHPSAFSMWLAGGGVKAGAVVGETDELGCQVTRDPVHVHDLQATILHCLGLDHRRLTYRHRGRDFRLTDVAGAVVSRLLA